ncbi:MAG: Ribosomal RNA small subunit methyltransferase A [Chlamydiae bacterium]|nr:Ribosomal RNA small subunit methyltransferase A [Chlamydiota bacterium]
MVYQPTKLKAFLDQLNVRPKKHLSQNFLIDQNILDKIVRFADLKPSDLVIEIGAGPGALSEKLLKKAQVIAIEKDRVFARALLRLDHLEVLNEDVLKVDFSTFKKCKVVANLPYNITTPILTKLVGYANIQSITIMVQKEVADRILSQPNTKDFSSLTLFLQYHAMLKKGFFVSRNCFYPKPSVDSYVLQLTLHQKYRIKRAEEFFQIIRKCFQQRRKMIKTTLKEDFDRAHLEAFFGKRRPENVSLDEWLTFFQKIPAQQHNK